MMVSQLDFNEVEDLMDFNVLLNVDFNPDDLIKEIFDEIPNNNKPMDRWEPSEVVNFIRNEVRIDPKSIEKFSSISGYIFRNLPEDTCKILANSSYLGEIIYKIKENHIKGYLAESSDHNNFYPFSPVPVEKFSSDNSMDSENCNSNEKCGKKPGRPKRPKSSDKIGNNKRSEKLWEFLLHLLHDSKTCPHLIKWENFTEGTFKFVQSDKVARLWGSRKQNENMTYEKFSRAMRYHYKSQILLPVPGKRLVYKFGPHAKRLTTL